MLCEGKKNTARARPRLLSVILGTSISLQVSRKGSECCMGFSFTTPRFLRNSDSVKSLKEAILRKGYTKVYAYIQYSIKRMCVLQQKN